MNCAKKNAKARKSPVGSFAKLMQGIGCTGINDNSVEVVYEDSKVKLLKIGDKTDETADRKEAVSEHLNDLYEGQDLCDLTLHLGNDKLNIHKVALSRCSQKYLDIFSGENVASKQLSDITFAEGIQLESAKQVVQFLYKRKINLTSDNIADVLAISVQLGITLLVDRCKEFMKKCSAAEIAKYVVWCEQHRLDDVKRELIGLASKHFDEVSKSDEFVKLSADDFIAILSTSGAHINGEAPLFQAMLKWIEAAPERSQFAAQLLKTVNLKQVHPRCIALLDANAEASKVVEVKRVLLDAYKHHALFAPFAPASSPPRMVAKCGRPKNDTDIYRRFSKKPAIVAIGGRPIPSDGKTNGEPVRNFFEYEMSGKTKRWGILMSMPESFCFHSTVYARGKLYVLGGCAVVSPAPSNNESTPPALKPVNTVHCYDPADGRWGQAAPMRQKRMFFPAVELAGSVYVLGGIGEDNKTLDSVECFSPRVNKWKSFPPLPLGCAGSAACAHAGTIFVAGGYLTTFGGILTMSTVFFYNFEAERWDAKAPMKQKTFFASAVEAAGALYILGGTAIDHDGDDDGDATTSRSLAAIWRCNEDATDWTSVGTLKMPRHSFGAVAVGNLIYAIGGLSYGQVSPLATVEVFNVATRRVTNEPELNLPYPLSGSAFASIPKRT